MNAMNRTLTLDLKVFRGRRGDIMKSIMRAIIPKGGPFEACADDFDLLPVAEALLRTFDPTIRTFFPLVLTYVQYSSILRTGRTFTRLSERQGAGILSAMEESPFYYRRMMLLLLKLVTMLTFYDIDENAALTGYVHGCHSLDSGKKKRGKGKAHDKDL